jgi:hypothetical protein
MYEVSKHYYTKFLPAVIETAGEKSPALKKKYQEKVEQLLMKEENRWIKGLSPQEIEALQKAYKERYNQ